MSESIALECWRTTRDHSQPAEKVEFHSGPIAYAGAVPPTLLQVDAEFGDVLAVVEVG